jgi:hypothetical protein
VRQLGEQRREIRVIARPGPLGLAAEALHALRHVGLEADPRLLAVVHDVDAARHLLLDDVAHRALALPPELGAIHLFAVLVADQQVGQHGIARQAADMGGENSVIAAVHGRFLQVCWATALRPCIAPRAEARAP